jgi:hypothetical protein
MKNENIKNVLILIGIFVFVLGVSCLINNNSNNFNMLENFEQEDENFTEHMKHLDKKEHTHDSTEDGNEDED